MFRLLKRITRDGRHALALGFPISILAGITLGQAIKHGSPWLFVLGLLLVLVFVELAYLHYRFVKRQQETDAAVRKLIHDMLWEGEDR